MSFDMTRRTLLNRLGVLGGAFAVGPQVVTADPVEDRWVCDVGAGGMSAGELSDDDQIDVLEDLSEEVGYCVVECSEGHLPADCDVDFSEEKFQGEYDEDDFDKENVDELLSYVENDETLPYVPDIELTLANPEVEHESGLNASNTTDEALYDLQWDKQDQRIGQVHDRATGDSARIGVVDSGILGANPNRSVTHSDLPNVREDLSASFSILGGEPGPVDSVDHGTHVAGIAGAAANDVGVVGVAPESELVDLRVFPGASTFGIAQAVVYGATDEDQGGAGCDVVNLSLGLGPLPVCSFIGLLILLFYYPVYETAAQYALDNGCLPVTSAGNDSTNHADPDASGFCEDVDIELFGESGFFSLPASVDEYLTVGATGPIGYGWDAGSNGKGNGKGKGNGNGGSKEVAGFEIEQPIQTEQKSHEPAFFTDYGGGEVNVTAAGGNADLDARDEDANWFYDLVFNTTFAVEENDDGDLEFTGSWGWKAGTSMASPQVAGLAALLASVNPDASPAEIRDTIEETASQKPVGQAGSTTAPNTYPDILGESEGTNLTLDDEVDGDQPSNPGSNPETLDSSTYRGSGHVDLKKAVQQFDD